MLTPTDIASHAALGIEADLLQRAQVRRVDDLDGHLSLGLKVTGMEDFSGILYPYNHPKTGYARAYRLRRDHPEIEDEKVIKKYVSSLGGNKCLYFPPDCAALLADLSVIVIAVEAEKSVLAITSAATRLGRRVLAIGLGGVDGWRGTKGNATSATGKTVKEKGVLNDFDLLALDGRHVAISFDANAATNPKVKASERRFAAELRKRGASVRIVALPVESGINGPDDFIGRHGAEAYFALVDAASDAPTNAIVVSGGQLSSIVDRAECALVPALTIYQRGGTLTRAIVLDTAIGTAADVRRDAGSIVLAAVSEPWLGEQMSRATAWVKWSDRKHDYLPIDVPPLYPRTLLSRGEWRFPVLRGVTSAPTLARDGRLIDAPGFDAASGLLLNFLPGAFPPMPARPTKDDALDAILRLGYLLRGFPFVSDGETTGARSVALSSILTALVRLSLRTAPLHAFDAPTAGTGKSLLAELSGLIATGCRPPAMSQGKSDEEDEKRLSTVLYAGDPVIHIDNCDRAISGDFLCSMLTQEVVQARILGLSERRVLPANALVLASGNNLQFSGDTSRRAVICRLDAEAEHPDEREFDFDCHADALAGRHAFVMDGLTVLRAYHLAGRPERLTPMGSFADWDLVRGALVWLGYDDPAITRAAILRNDPKKDDLAAVLALWAAAFGPEVVKISDVTTRPEASTLKDKLIEVCCRKKDWSGKSVGWWLRRNQDRIVGGLSFRCFPDDAQQSRWQALGAPERVGFSAPPAAHRDSYEM